MTTTQNPGYEMEFQNLCIILLFRVRIYQKDSASGRSAIYR